MNNFVMKKQKTYSNLVVIQGMEKSKTNSKTNSKELKGQFMSEWEVEITLKLVEEEMGDEKVFAKELENEYCEPCKANQCNYCSVYVIQTKYLD